MKLIICLGYKEIYQDVPPKDLNNFLANIPIKPALSFICDLTAQTYLDDSDTDFNLQQFNIVNDWIIDFDHKIKSRIRNLFKEYGLQNKSINIINQTSSLLVINKLLLKKDDTEVDRELSKENLENLFKFYLNITSEWTNIQASNIEKGKTDLKYYPLLLSLAHDEHFKIKDFRIQFIKIFLFFNFCETNSDFKIALEFFLKVKNLPSWQNYILYISSSYAQLVMSKRIKTAMSFSEDPNDQLLFSYFNKLTINPTDFKGKSDFAELRSLPLLSISNNILLFLNFNFFVDKIYNGFMFDFAETLIDHKIKIGKFSIKRRPDFFSLLGKNFIENELFGQIIKSTFSNKNYQHFDTKKLDLLIGDGAPDYLIIDKSKIYVFEFKNMHFNADVKISGDLERIKSEVKLKLLENNYGKPKAIRQLTLFINRINKNEFRTFFEKDGESYIIYPIILTNESVFDLNGFTTIIDSIYLSEISKLKSWNNLKDLTMINLDTLIKYKMLFEKRHLTINHVLSDYREFLLHQRSFDNKGLSFEQYMKSKASKFKDNYLNYFLKDFSSIFTISKL